MSLQKCILLLWEIEKYSNFQFPSISTHIEILNCFNDTPDCFRPEIISLETCLSPELKDQYFRYSFPVFQSSMNLYGLLRVLIGIKAIYL